MPILCNSSEAMLDGTLEITRLGLPSHHHFVKPLLLGTITAMCHLELYTTYCAYSIWYLCHFDTLVLLKFLTLHSHTTGHMFIYKTNIASHHLTLIHETLSL